MTRRRLAKLSLTFANFHLPRNESDDRDFGNPPVRAARQKLTELQSSWVKSSNTVWIVVPKLTEVVNSLLAVDELVTYWITERAVLHLHVLALGNVPLTCGWFCERGLIHHKPFWRHQAKPATFLPGQTTTPGTPCPTLLEQYVGSFTSRRIMNSEEMQDGAYGFIVLVRED